MFIYLSRKKKEEVPPHKSSQIQGEIVYFRKYCQASAFPEYPEAFIIFFTLTILYYILKIGKYWQRLPFQDWKDIISQAKQSIQTNYGTWYLIKNKCSK